LCSEPLSAELTRQHNDANVLAMGARTIGPEMAKKIVETFLDTEFMGGKHATRVAMLDSIK
ncbi:MAG: RpiB/LacA/LacB family sugar-phosphate isomerase, partial [Christensenellaceae bacterium]|nr:RpiB/LacA/LacB family sugar-phosphate isomerase [Christensenellaceae bacterium]